MKTTKMAKLLSIILSIAMLLGMLQIAALAETTVVYENDFNTEEAQSTRASKLPFSDQKENPERFPDTSPIS